MENVKLFFTRNWYFFAYPFCFVCIILGSTKLLHGCSNSVEKIGNEATNEAIKQIKLNNEIEGLQRQVEAIENHVFKLDSQIARVDSLRIKNFADSRNKSLLDNYSELSKRYTKQKPVR